MCKSTVNTQESRVNLTLVALLSRPMKLELEVSATGEDFAAVLCD